MMDHQRFQRNITASDLQQKGQTDMEQGISKANWTRNQGAASGFGSK